MKDKPMMIFQMVCSHLTATIAATSADTMQLSRQNHRKRIQILIKPVTTL